MNGWNCNDREKEIQRDRSEDNMVGDGKVDKENRFTLAHVVLTSRSTRILDLGSTFIWSNRNMNPRHLITRLLYPNLYNQLYYLFCIFCFGRFPPVILFLSLLLLSFPFLCLPFLSLPYLIFSIIFSLCCFYFFPSANLLSFPSSLCTSLLRPLPPPTSLLFSLHPFLSLSFPTSCLYLTVRNHALGNNPCYPYDSCVETHMGGDLDVLTWEQVRKKMERNRGGGRMYK